MQANRQCARSYVQFCLLVFTVLSTSLLAFSQAPAANSDPAYVQLRNLKLGQETVLTENVVLKREFATFTFRDGTMYFAEPVNGKVTAAVFVGDGSLVLKPELPAEKRSLSLLSKSPDFNERFEVVVLRFTDGTYDELKKSGKPAPNPSGLERAAKALADHLQTMRDDRAARYNLSARILQDVLAPAKEGLFAAYIHGKNYDSKEAFVVDPQGVTAWGLQPDEVAFMTYDENKYGFWASTHLQREYSAGLAKGSQMNGPVDLVSQKLDAEIHKNAEMRVTATTTFAAARDGLRVAPFSLFRNFKIESLTDASGQPLPYIFEKRSWSAVEGDDPDNLSIILPKALAQGEKFTFKITYGGKEAVSNQGGGNYFPEAREDWFPATRIGDYAEYEMTFRIPKGMKIAATGTLLSEKTDGDWDVSEWKTEVPIGVAGFNFGKFKVTEQKSTNGFIIQTCANSEPPDWVRGLQNAVNEDSMPGGSHMAGMALGTMDTTTMMKKPMAEAQIAMDIYSDYFGPLPYKRLSMTQQTACNFGQAWPGLVWLPICSFFDTTVRHQLGVDDTVQPYWNVVAPHEIAHEWWGHTVGWASYRDQWMSEGFAELSASIFAQAVYSKSDRGLYHRLWQTQQKALQEKNQWGFRPIDVGPLSMGFRVNSTKAGNIYSTLIYDKGSFVLHMLRMMMWDRSNGDKNFKETMRDFVATYQNRAASTEDFKAMVEKHMTANMDLDGNHKMDWFFNEWVYGTDLPKYDFTYKLDKDSNGGDVLSFTLTQSNVSPQFKMLVPIYVELQNGAVVNIGSASLRGNSSIDQKVPMGNKGINLKRMLINYNYDVLSEN